MITYRIYSRISRSAYKSNQQFRANILSKIENPHISRIKNNGNKVSLFDIVQTYYDIALY
jgi:hypothetical protein